MSIIEKCFCATVSSVEKRKKKKSYIELEMTACLYSTG